MDLALSCDAYPDVTAGPRRWWLMAAGTAWVATATGFTIWGQFSAGTAAGLLAADIAIGAAGCVLIPFLGRWPVAVTLVLGTLAAVSPAATPPATVAVLYTAQRRRFTLAVLAGTVGAAAHIIRGLWRPVSGLSFTWWLILVIAAYAALIGVGALAQARRALLLSLRERAQRAEAEQGRRVAEARALERTRIAREMHDVLAHRLSLVATYAGALEYRPDAPPEQLSRAAGVIRAGIHQALGELREVISVLRDGDPAGDPGEHPQPVLADLPRLVSECQDAGTRVELRDQVAEPAALPAAAGRTAYRVVQEALTNARKHAAGQPVQVALAGKPGTRLLIDISNPLPAAPAAGPQVPGTGTGLVGLTERVQLAGGQLDHQVTAAGEFRVQAWLPWPA